MRQTRKHSTAMFELIPQPDDSRLKKEYKKKKQILKAKKVKVELNETQKQFLKAIDRTRSYFLDSLEEASAYNSLHILEQLIKQR